MLKRTLSGRYVLAGLLCSLIMLLPGQERRRPNSADIMAEARHKAADGAFDEAIALYTKAAREYGSIGAPGEQIVALTRAGEVARTMGDLDQATKLLNEAGAVLPSDRQDARTRGELAHLQSNILSDQGEYLASIQEMKRAVEYKRRSTPTQDSSIALSINNIGYNFYFLNAYDSALIYYQQAVRQIKPETNPTSLDLAMFYQNIGIVHAIQDELDSALHYISRSAEIREQKLAGDDPDLAYTYTNLGRLYRMLGDDVKAYEYNTRAEEVYVKHFGTDYPGLGTLYLNTGNNLKVMGDYERAVSYYRKSLYIYSVSGNPRHPNVAKIFNNLGAVHLLMDQDSLAEQYLLQSLRLSEGQSLETITYRNLARIRQRSGDYSAALQYLAKASSIARVLPGNSLIENANLSLDYGLVYKDMQMTDSALQCFDRAISVFSNVYGAHHPDLAAAYTAKAALRHNQGRNREALRLYQLSLLSLVSEFTDTNYLANPDPGIGMITTEILDPILGKANVLLGLSGRTGNTEYLRQSLGMLNHASAIVDVIRNQLTDNSKQMLTKTLHDLYEKGIAVSFRLYGESGEQPLLADAFRFMEKSKYAVLLSSMRDVEAKEFGGIPDSLREREKLTRDRITAYQKLISEESFARNPDQKKLGLWENSMFELKKDLNELITQFEEEYPRYFSLKYENAIIPLNQLCKQLKSDEALVEYFMGDTSLYVLYVTANEVVPHIIKLSSRFYSSVSTIRSSLRPDALNSLNMKSFTSQQVAAYWLYEQLLFPAETLLADKHLIIVPDDILGYISFDLLLTSPADTTTMDYRSLPYLLRKHEISYSYLATLTYSPPEQPNRRRSGVVGFAPSYDNIHTLPEKRIASLRGMEKYLLPIEYAQEEMDMVDRVTRAEVYKGENATEKNFKSIVGSSDIIHLAMHTLVDDENPMFSKLAFTLEDEGMEDGLLNTYEIYNMDFNARLVVLSACNTGTGQLQRGEGIISLARAFMYAGVPGIVMTLWAVEDKSGSIIMEGFYENLTKGQTKREALRNSKLAYLESADRMHSHPYFWAAYVNIGDDSPLYLKTRHIVLFASTGLVLLVGVFMIYRRRRRQAIPSGS